MPIRSVSKKRSDGAVKKKSAYGAKAKSVRTSKKQQSASRRRSLSKA